MREDGQAERWFSDLVDLPAKEREQRLAQAPPDVAAEVARLLRCHDAADAGFLEPPLPQRIGPYRPVAELGRGGMGVVYLALRTSPPLERPVALKLLGRLAQPLSAEARALARLEHPNIARFLDAGVAGDGQSYLAMQYIAGVPIDAWCEEQRLSARARVQLFLKACAAVSYAHQQLVLLCDLKPAHLLVDAAGEPQLLDFGIARLLDADAAGSGLAGAYLTPGYASPEQRRGEPLTTASDVYALGAILQRLLGGARDADLEAIAAKAQVQDTAARYSSVDALAQDLRRYLLHRPPLAAPGPWQHRTRLLLRRQRTPVLIASVIALALAGGLAGTLWQMQRARREARLAEQRGSALQQLAAADLLQLDDAVERLPGGTQAREQMVDDSLARLQRLADEPGANAMTRYDLALGYLKLAQLQGAPYQPNLGHTRQALASAQRAGAMLALLQHEEGGNGAAQQVIAARILAGRIETRLGRYAQAETWLRQARQAAAARLRQYPTEPAAMAQAAAAALALGDPLLYQQHLRQAHQLYSRALQLDQRLLARAPADVGALYAMSTAYHRRAGLERDEALLLARRFGQQRAALPLLHRSVGDYLSARELSVVLLEAAPGSEEYQRWNASVDGDLAMALASVGRYATAQQAANKGVDAAAALAAADPANVEAQFELAVAYGARAQVELPRAPAAAHTDLRQAERLGEQIYGADPTDVENTVRLRGMLEIDYNHSSSGNARTRTVHQALALGLELERLDPGRPQTAVDLANTRADLVMTLLSGGKTAAARQQLLSVGQGLAALEQRGAVEPDLWLAAAKVEAAAAPGAKGQAAAARDWRKAAAFQPCTSAAEWAAVSEAHWRLGQVASAIDDAGRGLADLPAGVLPGRVQIESGLRRAWGRPGPADMTQTAGRAGTIQ